MKLKQVLFGGLLLAVPFTACTNEELMDTTVSSSPEEIMSKAISLGDNFSIVANKGKGADTRAIIKDNFSLAWEKTDEVGAAFFGAKTGESSGELFTYGGEKKFLSNHPFTFNSDLSEAGDMTKVEFKTNTQAFAGKYVLYYPFNKEIVQLTDQVSIEIPQNQEMDCAADGKPLDHVSKNLFAWCDATLDGGPQTGDFELKQAGNIVVINLGANAEIAEAIVGKTIEKVILQSNDNLHNAASIKVNGSAYGDATGKYIEGTVVNSFILTPKDATADYQITGAGEAGMAKKPFYMAMLPAKSGISTLTVQVLMSDGKMYKKDIAKNDHKKAYDNIVAAGKKVTLNVVLDEEVSNADIYTEEQFAAAMAKATTTMTLGADITLADFDFSKSGKSVTISGDGSLTVNGAMNVTAGSLTIESKLTAKGGVTVAGDGVLTVAKCAEMGALTVDGVASITGTGTENVASATMGAAAELTLKDIKIGNLDFNGRGANLTLDGATLTGSTTSAKENATITLSGDATNEGTATFTGATISTGSQTFTNKGTMTLNGTTVKGTNGITNDVNATLNISGAAATISKITNTVGTAEAEAGIVNINMAEAATELTAAITNNGVLNINKGVLTESAANAVGLGASSITEIKENGKLLLNSSSDGTNCTAGAIIKVVKADNIALNNGSFGTDKVDVQMEVTSTETSLNSAPTGVTTLIMNAAGYQIGSGNANAIGGINLILKKNIVLDNDLTMTKALNVEGNVTITGITSSRTLKLAAGNVITENRINGTLTIGENVTLEGNSSNASVVVLVGGSRVIATDGTLTKTNIKFDIE